MRFPCGRRVRTHTAAAVPATSVILDRRTGRRQAANHPGVGAVQTHLEHVLAVNRKIMARDDPAPRSKRKLLAEPLVLRKPRGLVRVVLERRVALEAWRNRRIADREPGDLR